MSQPLAIAFPCDCGDCDFCGASRDKSTPNVVELWRKAGRGDNVNTDLHICRKCVTNLLELFDKPELTTMRRGKIIATKPTIPTN